MKDRQFKSSKEHGRAPIGKYDSISISDTQDTRPDNAGETKKYLVVRLLENAADEEGYSGQSRAYAKTFFEDTHSTQFIKGEEAREAGNQMKILGSFHDVETQPYNPKDVEGVYLKNPNTGEKAVARRVRFFLLADESLQAAVRAATRNLDFLEEVEPGDETEEAKSEALTDEPEDKTE